MPWHIERIQPTHDCSQFKCRHNSLDFFIRRFALKNDQSDLGITYVAVEPGSTRVVGFHTLVTGHVRTMDVPETEGVPFDEIPVVLIARLAVDRSAQKKGLGGALLIHALKKAQETSQSAGAYAVVVDALNDEARSFYLHYDFAELKDDKYHLFLRLQKAREVLAAVSP